jgi:hypothetical protein
MKSKLARDPILWFLLRFLVVFGVLVAPWPGWNGLYAQYFQSLGQVAFSLGDANRVVDFKPATGQYPGLDTQVTLGNRALADSSGKALVQRAEIDSRSIGWVPTALTLGLVAATPIPWRRRVTALVGGWVLVHLFIFFTLQAWVWNNSSDVSLLALPAFWQRVVGELNYALLNQIGASFSVPVIIWILVTFRRQDALA